MNQKTWENILSQMEAIPPEQFRADFDNFLNERKQQRRTQIEKVTIPLKEFSNKVENELNACQGCCEDVDTYFDIIHKCRSLATLLEDFYKIY